MENDGKGRAEMENISTLYRIGPTFGDFVTILTERSVQDIKVEKSQVTFTAIVIRRKIVQCYCVHRVVVHCSVSINKSDPCRHTITKGEYALYSSN